MAEVKDTELNGVSGGAGGWQKYAKGSYVNYGNYIVPRFGVTVAQIQQWNNIKNPDVISVGQKLTIYPAIIR